jgi:hypothetical protein
MEGVIYKITSPSGKIYVGQTFDINKRLYHYKNGDCKKQKKLYRSLNKYGFENHIIELIDKSNDRNFLLYLEKFYIKLFDSYNTTHGMNLTMGGEGCNINHHSEETKKKISESKKNKPKTEKQILAHLNSFGKKHSEDRNKKKSISQGGKNHWAYGRKFSDDTIRKKSESMKIKYKSGYKHPRMGVELDSELKDKIRLSKSIPISQYSKSGDLIKNWTSAKEASLELGISHGNITNCCKGRNKSAGGYIWKYNSMKYKINEKINKFISFSFDFDGTLDDEFDGTPNPQKEEIQNICKSLVEQGKDVCIITKRYSFDTGMGESDKVYQLALRLGVSDVHFTNREFKHEKIHELGIQVHFENAEYESGLIQEKNPQTLVIHIEDPYWRDLVY